MLDQPTEVRCPTDRKLLIGLADDFDGAVSTKCHRCKNDSAHPPGVTVPPVQLRCLCRRWLVTGVIHQGACRVSCSRCRALVAITPAGPRHLEPPRDPRFIRLTTPRRDPTDRIVALIEERWELLRLDRAHRSVDLAVGLRFDIFNRDHFRCRYCGRGPEQGILLEVDHVVPRSAGGLDLRSNLVTACWDCNRGKSDKRLLTA